MLLNGLIFGLCSVGYAFINFEDVSRNFRKSTSRTLIVEQPYSIINVSNCYNHMKDRRLTQIQFVNARAGHRW